MLNPTNCHVRSLANVSLGDTEPVVLEAAVDDHWESIANKGAQNSASSETISTDWNLEENVAANDAPDGNGQDGDNVEEVCTRQLVLEFRVRLLLDEESEVEPSANNNWHSQSDPYQAENNGGTAAKLKCIIQPLNGVRNGDDGVHDLNHAKDDDAGLQREYEAALVAVAARAVGCALKVLLQVLHLLIHLLFWFIIKIWFADVK